MSKSSTKEKAKKEEEKVRADTSTKLADAEERIRVELKSIGDNSESVNEELENLLK